MRKRYSTRSCRVKKTKTWNMEVNFGKLQEILHHRRKRGLHFLVKTIVFLISLSFPVVIANCKPNNLYIIVYSVWFWLSRIWQYFLIQYRHTYLTSTPIIMETVTVKQHENQNTVILIWLIFKFKFAQTKASYAQQDQKFMK